jgi:hypothetical protein
LYAVPFGTFANEEDMEDDDLVIPEHTEEEGA